MRARSYLQLIVTVSFSILFAFALFFVGLESITPVWVSSLPNQISLIIILAILILWIIGWVAFDLMEATEVDSKLSDHVSSKLKIGAMIIGITIAIAFGAMISTLGKIELFVPLFGFIVLTASIGDHVTIKRLFTKVKDKDPKADEQLINYYTENPHMLLHCVQLFFIVIAAGLYIFLIRDKNPGNEWIVYAIISISIIINEYYLWKWRFARFKEDN